VARATSLRVSIDHVGGDAGKRAEAAPPRSGSSPGLREVTEADEVVGHVFRSGPTVFSERNISSTCLRLYWLTP
jgi:hypothetical protein